MKSEIPGSRPGKPAHPLVELFAGLMHDVYPPFDGLTEVMPAPSGATGAVLGFTGHHVVAADVDPEWVTSRCPPGDLLAPVSPAFVLALGRRLGCAPSAIRLVLCASGQAGPPDLTLSISTLEAAHPRIARAHRYRTDVRIYETADGAGLLTVGRGLAGRWEAGLEVASGSRNHGLGRALVAASRHLIGPDEPLFMQIAIGNIASLRSILAGGFVPVGTEIVFMEEEAT